MKSNPILSICIPTYNRASSLIFSLKSAIEAVKDFENDVEIIISNNNSTDETDEILKGYNFNENVRYFKNNENIGFNLNYFKLVDEYALGEFCWVIGDDDFIHINAIKEIISVISLYPEVDFIYPNYRLELFESIVLKLGKNENVWMNDNHISQNGELCLFNDILSKENRSTNILISFISSSIFRTRLIKKFPKHNFGSVNFKSYSSVFPHSYMFAIVMANKKAYYFKHPLLTAAIQKKEWDKHLPMLYLKIIPDLLKHYQDQGYSNKSLYISNQVIINAGLSNLIYIRNWNFEMLRINLAFLYHNCCKLLFYKVLFEKIIKRFKNM